jgi:hypothetical protein
MLNLNVVGGYLRTGFREEHLYTGRVRDRRVEKIA